MTEDEGSTRLTAGERKALSSLNQDLAPPNQLEDRVVEALTGRGLIRHPPAATWRACATAATLAVAIASAFAAGRWSAEPASPKTESPRFMLLLYDTLEREVTRTAEQNRALASEYSAWARELDRVGRFAGGDSLPSAGRMLRQVDERIESGPGAVGSDEIVVGYFMIHARGYEEALEIAEACPHLKYDGGVLVRRVGHS